MAKADEALRAIRAAIASIGGEDTPRPLARISASLGAAVDAIDRSGIYALGERKPRPLPRNAVVPGSYDPGLSTARSALSHLLFRAGRQVAGQVDPNIPVREQRMLPSAAGVYYGNPRKAAVGVTPFTEERILIDPTNDLQGQVRTILHELVHAADFRLPEKHFKRTIEQATAWATNEVQTNDELQHPHRVLAQLVLRSAAEDRLHVITDLTTYRFFPEYYRMLWGEEWRDGLRQAPGLPAALEPLVKRVVPDLGKSFEEFVLRTRPRAARSRSP